MCPLYLLASHESAQYRSYMSRPWSTTAQQRLGAPRLRERAAIDIRSRAQLQRHETETETETGTETETETETAPVAEQVHRPQAQRHGRLVLLLDVPEKNSCRDVSDRLPRPPAPHQHDRHYHYRSIGININTFVEMESH